MYKFLVSAVIAVAGCSAAQATQHFTFSEQMGASLVSGSFDGTLSGNLISGISNVSVFINGLGPIGNGSLFADGYDTGTSSYVSGGAIASLDGTQNNFFFANSDLGVGDFSYNAYYYSFSQFGWGDVAYDNVSNQNPGTNDANFRAQLVEGQRSAVPEPASWAMMVAGFGLLGSLTRRDRVRRSIRFS